MATMGIKKTVWVLSR